MKGIPRVPKLLTAFGLIFLGAASATAGGFGHGGRQVVVSGPAYVAAVPATTFYGAPAVAYATPTVAYVPSVPVSYTQTTVVAAPAVYAAPIVPTYYVAPQWGRRFARY
jgi:hypothetical protein